MIKLSANLSFLFNEVSFKNKFKEASKVGFKAVEFLFPYEYNVNEIKRYLEENKLKLVLFNTHPGSWKKGDRGLASKIGRENEFKDNFYKTIEYANELNCPNIHVLAGVNNEKSSITKSRDLYIKNLLFCADLAKKNNFYVLIEAINNIDIPNYHLNFVSDAISIIKEILNSIIIRVPVSTASVLKKLRSIITGNMIIVRSSCIRTIYKNRCAWL